LAPDSGFPIFRSRILLVDDHPIVRQGMTQLINREKDLMVCGEAEDARTALDAIDHTKPDVVVIDISLPGPDGIDLIKAIRARHSKLPVLILSMHDESLYAERALRAGANGYLMKQEATTSILAALRHVRTGEIYVSNNIAKRLVKQFIDGPVNPARSAIDNLTDRELEVFSRISEGRSTRQIAKELYLSVKTVESYYANIKRKLSLQTSRELVQYAVCWLQRDGPKRSVED
jgi:DNA-binding NarL/FixJ family response regulator